MMESLIQQAIVKWCAVTYPKMVIYSIPNGGLRNKREALKLKAEGLLAGVFDLFIPELNLYLEVKKDEMQELSKHQIEFKEKMEKLGYFCFKVFDLLQTKKIINDLYQSKNEINQKRIDIKLSRCIFQ